MISRLFIAILCTVTCASAMASPSNVAGKRYSEQARKASDSGLLGQLSLNGGLLAASCSVGTAVLAVSIVADMLPFASVLPDLAVDGLSPGRPSVPSRFNNSPGTSARRTGNNVGVLFASIGDIVIGFSDALADGKVNDGRSNEKYKQFGSMTDSALLSSQNVANALLREDSLCQTSASKFMIVAKELNRRLSN